MLQCYATIGDITFKGFEYSCVPMVNMWHIHMQCSSWIASMLLGKESGAQRRRLEARAL
jgi:hypothetical protein